MEISVKLTIGMVCTFVAIIIVLIISVLLYRQRKTTANHPIVIAMSLIALTISVSTAIYLFCGDSTNTKYSFNYSDTSVAVLSVLVALLTGWNILSAIEMKYIKREVEAALSQLLKERSEMFASIHEDFSLVAIDNYIRAQNSSNAYLVVRHFIESIMCYQYIHRCKKADELIELLIKTIPTNVYNVFGQEEKEKIIGVVLGMKNNKEMKRYNELKQYVLNDIKKKS